MTVASLDLPLVRTARDFRTGIPSTSVRVGQDTLAWAQHWLILYPLWLGSMPALLKGFFEQIRRPGFAFAAARGRGLPRKLLAGRLARVVVTMGMPGIFDRWDYRQHSLKRLERNILAFLGVSPVRATVIGAVEAMRVASRQRWLRRRHHYGTHAR